MDLTDDPDSPFYGAELTFSYSRAQAIADGQFVEVPPALAAEAGITVPVAMTDTAWADLVAWTDATDAAKPGGYTGQSETGRLWDVLWMTRYAIATAPQRGDRVTVELARVPAHGPALTAEPVTLIAHIGPGDNAEPVLTLMLPGED